MTDRAYIISRTFENKIAMAENNGIDALLVTLDVLKEILSMLKEQEAVKPIIDEYGNERCGSCGHKLQSIADPDLFCCKCGRPVLWEGR